MEEYNVDIKEMEKQRYESIKKSGRYAELSILVGAEKEVYNGQEGVMPVITLDFEHCGSSEVSCLYAIVNKMKTYLEQEYPMECLHSSSLSCTEINNFSVPSDNDKTEEV